MSGRWNIEDGIWQFAIWDSPHSNSHIPIAIQDASKLESTSMGGE